MASNTSTRLLSLLIASAGSFRLKVHKHDTSNGEADMGLSGESNVKYTSRSSLPPSLPIKISARDLLPKANSSMDSEGLQGWRNAHPKMTPEVNGSGNVQQRPTPARIQEANISSLQNATKFIDSVTLIEEANRSSLLQNSTNYTEEYIDALNEIISHNGTAETKMRLVSRSPMQFCIERLFLICLALLAFLSCICVTAHSFQTEQSSIIQEAPRNEQSPELSTERSSLSTPRGRDDTQASWLHKFRSVMHLRSSNKG